MRIPIHHESSSTSASNVAPNSSSYTYKTKEKKFVQITPKITDVEILYPSKKPEPIITVTAPSKLEDHFAKSLQVFENENKTMFSKPAWFREEIEIFPSRSVIKEQFDNMTKQLMTNSNHPIQIDTFKVENDQYVLSLNVKQFKPEELQVKVTDDSISITGRHEEKKDEQNFNLQEYSRKHSLPQGVTADDVRCKFAEDGTLTITAPRKEVPPLVHSARTIPISYGGRSAIRV